MTDQTPHTPTSQDKIITALATLADEMRQSKIQMQDIHAQRAEYAADIRDLKAAIDTTRRALDPKTLGEHVADNIDTIMGEQVGLLAKAVNINHGIAQQNADTATKLHEANSQADTANRNLANIATRIEQHAERSKWDWATLAAGMTIAALLAGGGAVFFTKQNLDTANFKEAVKLIASDDDAYWCRQQARAATFKSEQGNWYCAIHMPQYQEPEDEAGESDQ